MNRAQKKSNVDASIRKAEERAANLIADLPVEADRQRDNLSRISAICMELVSAKPIQEPIAEVVSDLGRVKFGKFPKTRTLYNSYRSMLQIWRDAYANLLSANAPAVTTGSEMSTLSRYELAGMDIATRVRVQFIEAQLKRSKSENDKLKSIITKNIPALGPATGSPSISIEHAETLRSWLDDLERGAMMLEEDSGGLRVSRRSRPGTLVVPATVLEAARKICAVAIPPPGAREAMGLPNPSAAAIEGTSSEGTQDGDGWLGLPPGKAPN